MSERGWGLVWCLVCDLLVVLVVVWAVSAL